MGRVREITPGFAAFTLTDVALTYCGQTEKEGCENPWDYCCHDSADIAKHTIAVAVKTPGGEIVAVPVAARAAQPRSRRRGGGARERGRRRGHPRRHGLAPEGEADPAGVGALPVAVPGAAAPPPGGPGGS